MASNTQNYKKFVGTVAEIVNAYKAIVEFHDLGIKQRALLKVEKFICKPNFNSDGSEDRAITDFVSIGTALHCLSHKYDETGEHKCGWYVAEVLTIGQELTGSEFLAGLCPTMLFKTGWVSHLEKRQGIISFKDENDKQLDILLLASKFYDGGKRITVKQPLDKYIAVNDKVYFDAVPIDPEENETKCSWLATLAWRRSKPPNDYDSIIEDPDRNLSQIKTIIRNPNSKFIRGKGQIMRILSEGYGIALGAVNIQQTHWQSILFHRSCASLFKYKLSNVDIRQVFKEGDKIRFIAASAPIGFSAQWVASNISIDVVGDAQKLVKDL